MADETSFGGFVLQEKPPIYLAAIPGEWLLKRTSPSWRLEDPEDGFQRVVKETRAKAVATAVLNQHKTFPNAIVLATDKIGFDSTRGEIKIPNKTKFLVVDGQHRLWAQKYSDFKAIYACTIHCGLDEVKMAELFIEINNNQKRVPSSLRWDLVRLVRPDEDPFGIVASDLVYELATSETSPLFQRIDLTGEQSEIGLKQGSIAPEFRHILSAQNSPFKETNFDVLVDCVIKYLAAIKSMDADGWRKGTSAFYQARVLRGLIRILPEIILHEESEPIKMSTVGFKKHLEKINQKKISRDALIAKHGSSGLKSIYDEMHSHIFG